MMEIIKIKDAVAHFLINEPQTRDNGHLLQLKVWAEQMPELRDKKTSFWDFATVYMKGELASSESIRRCRQKLQEIHPALRGIKYQQRHENQENVKEQLKNFEK